MEKSPVKYTFWHWFGLISAFIFLIIISLLVYNFFSQNKSVVLKAHIEAYPFSPPPNLNFRVSQEKEAELIKKIQENLPLKDPNAVNTHSFYQSILYDFTSLYADYLKNYHTFYIIELSNPGNKTATGINIDLKSKGKYLIDFEHGNIEFSDYQNHISIDELNPGQNLSLLIWSEIILKDYSDYEPKSISIFCKQGDAKITWPVKVNGIAAWNSIHNNYPLIFSISGFLVIVVVLMIVFFNLGCRNIGISAEKRSDI